MEQENIELLEDIEIFQDNPERRCPVVLLLDTSKSMSGERISQLISGIKTFKEAVQKDATASLRVEVAIIVFSSTAELIQDFVSIKEFEPPSELTTSGLTAIGQGIELALGTVRTRTATYREYGISSYKPWIFLITDGHPTDEWIDAAEHVKSLLSAKKISFFAVGVQNANMNILKKIAPAKRLDGLKFQELFRWVSDSLVKVSHSRENEQIELPPTTGWDYA